MSSVDRRLERMNKRLQQVLGATILMHTGNPLFKTVSITRVETARDYKSAKVYFSCFVEEQSLEIRKALAASEGFFRARLQDSLDLPQLPHLNFIFDRTLIDSHRVLSIMDQVKRERDEDTPQNVTQDTPHDHESDG